VKSGKYSFYGKLRLEGLEKDYDFQMDYEVIPVYVKVIPDQIELGLIRRLSRTKKGEILIELQKKKNLKISGYAISSDPSILQISPSTFNGSKSIEYRVSLRNSVVGLINTEVRIEINGEKIIVPIDFVAEIDYGYLFLSYFPIGIVSGLATGLLRQSIESNIFTGNVYSVIAVMAVLAFTLMASNLINYNRSLTRRISSNKGVTSTISNESMSILITLSCLFTGIFFSWIVGGIGILSTIGYILFSFFDFISNVFYIVGIDSAALRWAVLSYVIVNVYFIIKARQKMRVKANNI
jgi:hypothetical protein